MKPDLLPAVLQLVGVELVDLVQQVVDGGEGRAAILVVQLWREDGVLDVRSQWNALALSRKCPIRI